MNIPKRIETLIRRRERASWIVLSADCELSEWLDKNNIEIDDIYTWGGCAVYAEPTTAANMVRRAILNTETDND